MNLSKIYLIRIFLFISLSSNCVWGQTIPPTNVQGNKPMPCWDCAPANWFDFGGTPDMSNRNQAAASGTSGGGATWTQAPLPLPPNGHTNWITIRDIGNNGTEESVGTNITGLVVGREYEVVAYTLSARANTYSPNYIDFFDFQVGTMPRVNVTAINRDTDNAWGVNRLRFTANSTSYQFAFYPGKNAPGSNYESVNISVSLNAVNTIPVAQHKTGTTTDQPVVINVMVGAQDFDAGQIVVVSSIDLDPSTPGIQNNITTSQGNWSVNHTTGDVTFIPAAGFIGTAVLPYTVQDNYSLDGVLSPGTSTPKNISITVSGPTECVKPVAPGTAAGYSKIGILSKSKVSVNNWPNSVPNGYLVLDAAQKGMVITHMNTSQRDALVPLEGMIIYNSDEECVQLYRGMNPAVNSERTGWNCITRTCND